jgi:hypothetical protein
MPMSSRLRWGATASPGETSTGAASQSAPAPAFAYRLRLQVSGWWKGRPPERTLPQKRSAVFLRNIGEESNAKEGCARKSLKSLALPTGRSGHDQKPL